MDTERECVDTEGKFTDMFKPALHGTAFDNKFIVTVDYKCMGKEGEKHVEINQTEDMKSLMKNEFFVDLTQNGPLYISKVHYTCKNKNSAYTVHKKLAKGISGIAVLFEKLNFSFVEELVVDLKFTKVEGAEEKGEAVEFGKLLTELAKMFRIKIGAVTTVRKDLNVDVAAKASLEFSEWYQNHFNNDRKYFLSQNLGSDFTAAYISTSYMAELDGSSEETDLRIPVLVYSKGRFELASIIKKIDRTSYRIRLTTNGAPESSILRQNFLVVEDAAYLVYVSILRMGNSLERTEADVQGFDDDFEEKEAARRELERRERVRKADMYGKPYTEADVRDLTDQAEVDLGRKPYDQLTTQERENRDREIREREALRTQADVRGWNEKSYDQLTQREREIRAERKLTDQIEEEKMTPREREIRAKRNLIDQPEEEKMTQRERDIRAERRLTGRIEADVRGWNGDEKPYTLSSQREQERRERMMKGDQLEKPYAHGTQRTRPDWTDPVDRIDADVRGLDRNEKERREALEKNEWTADDQCYYMHGKRHTKNNTGPEPDVYTGPKYDNTPSAYNANDPGSGLYCDLYRKDHEERERVIKLREEQARRDSSGVRKDDEAACSIL